MSSIHNSPPETDRDDRRWADATLRVRNQVEHGPRVRGFSNQIALPVMMVVVGGLATLARVGDPVSVVVIWQFALLGAGFVIAVVGYIRAKRGGRLLSQIPTPREEWPLAPFLPEERRSLARQMKGRSDPTDRSREIVRALIENARKNNASVFLSLVGLLLFLLSESLFLGWPWPLFVAGLALFLLIATRFEARRWRRALERAAPPDDL